MEKKAAIKQQQAHIVLILIIICKFNIFNLFQKFKVYLICPKNTDFFVSANFNSNNYMIIQVDLKK